MGFKMTLLAQFLAFCLVVILRASAANQPCQPGFTGINCTCDIDDCENVNCSGRGECIDQINGFSCRCNSGFFGVLCQEVADACNPNPCLNGGTCTVEGESFLCTCTGRFQGKNCEEDINDCENVNCSGRGQCIDGINSFACQCDSGFAGVLCQEVADACNPNPCLNGGTCTVEGESFLCTCTGRFQGKNCEEEKPDRTLSVTVTIRDRTYDPAYDDISSEKSRALSFEFKAIIVPFCRRKFPLFVSIRIIRFFPGSVGVDYDLVFEPTSNVTNNSIVEEFQKANATKELEFLVLDRLSAREVLPTTPPVTTITTQPVTTITIQPVTTVTTQPVTTVTTQPVTNVTTLPTATESSKLETWVIVVIVASIVALILVVIIIIFAVMYKREKTTGKEIIAFDGYWELMGDIKDKQWWAQHANGHRPNVIPYVTP